MHNPLIPKRFNDVVDAYCEGDMDIVDVKNQSEETGYNQAKQEIEDWKINQLSRETER